VRRTTRTNIDGDVIYVTRAYTTEFPRQPSLRPPPPQPAVCLLAFSIQTMASTASAGIKRKRVLALDDGGARPLPPRTR
jgi:hypothetical protein